MDDAICGGGGDGTVDAFRPEDIDVDEPPSPPEPPPPVIDVTARRAYVATSEEAPGPWPLPPSQTRKRPRGKGRHAVVAASALEQLKQDEAGRWACGACGSVYPDPTGLYGHLRFCSSADAWSCEWCHCSAHETHHKANGPAGPKTLCSACGQRYRSGHNNAPQLNEAGEFVCGACSRAFSSMAALGGHRRFCDGGAWRCRWCECKAEETQGKGPGPDGPSSLCAPCNRRWVAGHTGPPARDASGQYLCELCGRGFETIPGLGTHRSRCDGGVWACAWCRCSAGETSGKGPGPDGKQTLCSVCSARFRAGHSGPPAKTEAGLFVCERCERTFETFAARGIHMRRCDGGAWRCGWCESKYEAKSGKGPGPEGPGTLCSACSARFRSGATGPPQVDAAGKYLCDCGRTFETIGALGVHKRHCDGGRWRCGWCECDAAAAQGKGPGPDGPRTLCAVCASRFRAGHREALRRDADGKWLCGCGRAFDSTGGLGSHRRHCAWAAQAHGAARGSSPLSAPPTPTPRPTPPAVAATVATVTAAATTAATATVTATVTAFIGTGTAAGNGVGAEGEIEGRCGFGAAGLAAAESAEGGSGRSSPEVIPVDASVDVASELLEAGGADEAVAIH